MGLFGSKPLPESSSSSISDISNEQVECQLVYNDSDTSQNSDSSNDSDISNNQLCTINNQVKKINKLKFSNTGNLVAVTANEVTGDQIINIIQSKNKELRTPLKYGLPLAEENVIGRDNEVDELYKLLKSSDHKPVAITGMGGVGKTTLAIHCAYVWSSDEKYENIQNIAFLNAETDGTFKQSIKEFAEELNIRVENREIRGIMREIFNHFTKKGLLMIYDNVDSYSVVKDYLPENIPNVYILATSQITELKAFFNCFELKVLNDLDSKTLVMSVFSEESFSSINEEDVKELVRVFGGLPLGLLQAAAYIKDIIENEDDEYTIKDYMKKYNAYLDEPFPDDFKINYKYTVYIALKINIDKIKQDSTKQILWCMGYLDPSNIESKLFHEHFGEKQVKEAVRALVKYSIVKKTKIVYADFDPIEKLTMHRLLQEICRKNVEHEKIQYITLAIKFTVKSVQIWEHYAFIFPHIEDDLLIQVSTEGFRQAFDSGELLDYLNDELGQIELDESLLDHWDAWHFAIYCECDDIIEVFKQRGLIFNHKNHDWTPLHAAALRIAELDIKNTIKYLPKAFDINAQTSTGLTSLHISAALGHTDNIEELIKLGCDVNIRDKQGNTPLHRTAMNKNKFERQRDIMEKLINSGADINIKNNNNQTALEICGQVTNDVTIDDTVVECSQIIIIVRPESPSGELLEKYLISLDILINPTDGVQLVINKLNSCHWWNEQQEKLVPELINLLFNAHIALDIVTSYILKENISLEDVINILKRNDQHTELEMFVNFTESRYKNIYRVICMAIDRIEERNSDVFELLSYGIYVENIDEIEIMFEPDWWIKTRVEYYKEHYALLKRDGDYDDYYLDKEDYNINGLIRHIVHVYLLKRKTACSILEHILQTGLNTLSFIRGPLFFMHIKDIKLFIEREYENADRLEPFITKLRTLGCDITNTRNWSILHYTCADDCPMACGIVKRLIDLKFDVNISVNKITPIHLASFRESEYAHSVRTLQNLIEAGVNVRVETAEGITPLHLVYVTGQDFMGEQLIYAGADINARDCNGDTPSHYAARYGFEDILRELQKRGADQGVNCKGETPEDLLERAKKS